MSVEACFCERDPETLARLQKEVAAWQAHHPNLDARVHILPDAHEETTAEIARAIQCMQRPVLGLIYADPNGTALPVDVVRKLPTLPQLRRMDCLAYLS